MSLPSTPSSTPAAHAAAASHSAAASLGLARARRTRAGEEGDADFASQLRSAADDDGADAHDGDDATPDEATATASTSNDAAPAAAAAPAPAPADPSANWTMLLNPALAALAGRAAGAAGGPAGAAVAAGADALAGLAGKLAHRGGVSGQDALAADTTGGAATGTAKAALDAAQALALQAMGGDTGAANAATGTKDSAAAFLPDPDAGADAAALALAAATAGGAGAAGSLAGDPAASAATAASAAAQATIDLPPQSPAFAPALGRQIETWMKDGVQHAEVQLNPLELGPIRVRIAIEGDQTRVEMAADVAATRDALQQAMPQLADALGQVGLSLGGADVSDQPASDPSGQGADDGRGAFASPDTGRRGTGGSSAAGDAAAGTDALATAAARASRRRGLLDTYA